MNKKTPEYQLKAAAKYIEKMHEFRARIQQHEEIEINELLKIYGSKPALLRAAIAALKKCDENHKIKDD